MQGKYCEFDHNLKYASNLIFENKTIYTETVSKPVSAKIIKNSGTRGRVKEKKAVFLLRKESSDE
jgi:hypothetical protein